MKIGVEISDELICLIDNQARIDGHDNRDAVIRKALVWFFAEEVAFVAQDEAERKIMETRHWLSPNQPSSGGPHH